VGLSALYGDILAGHSGDNTSLALVADVAKKADKLTAVGAEGSNVVPFVVGVGTREGLAARDGNAVVQREDHLHTLGIIWVDNGRDIEVRGTSEAIETDLAEHARDSLRAVRDGEPVACPAGREGLIGGGHTGDDELRNGLKASVLSEDDGTLGVVLVDKVDRASGGEGGKRKGCEDGAEELHVD